jgi:hypothetical protein
VDFPKNSKSAGNYFLVLKFAVIFLGIPVDFPESLKSPENSSLLQHPRENP